mmetsp:Transcript_22962/g.26188  ORF Transcript_22962/g.26188 Transcript_22962/m.26188 type:complete len:202 (+) Transcript_22962:78-683(+)|eukprot:CAMPEP_0194140984 /NCGR_PEP_ID=MMETSP0152-20130528/10477_1 /TAXON_ID=1049557 /ORGANISM="Thalassiothrix antarctica, Strain L6-D1" /LENGTH=201 /DNA_ID=CAMNT_0038839461 /DNA_START=53 /DNA_END=658 /DNA_ORIENTATION=-
MTIITNDKRRVRFSEEKNQLFIVERFNPDEMWLSAIEQAECQQSLRLSILKIHNDMEQDYFYALRDFYFHIRNRNEKELSSEVSLNLAKYPDRRGLEFYSSRLIYNERLRQRGIMMRVLVEIQRRGKKLNTDNSLILAKVAEKLSSPAKAIALALGRTDSTILENQQTEFFAMKESMKKRKTTKEAEGLNPSKRIKLTEIQ